jgi:hypothetical protein
MLVAVFMMETGTLFNAKLGSYVDRLVVSGWVSGWMDGWMEGLKDSQRNG